MWVKDLIIKVSVNGKTLKEEVIYPGSDKSFSIDVDFSKCKSGDTVVIESDYVGNRDNPYLAIWYDCKTLVIEELVIPSNELKSEMLTSPLPTPSGYLHAGIWF